MAALAAPELDRLYNVSNATTLLHLTLIESAVSPVRWSDWFSLNGLTLPRARPVPRPSFDRGTLAVSAAVQGMGAALESTRFAQEELARGELVLLGGRALRAVQRELHFLCYRASQRDLSRILAFREWLLEILRQEPAHAEPFWG